MPLSNPDNQFQRQTLFWLTPTDSNNQGAKILNSPQEDPQRWENSVSSNLVAFNIKQTGNQTIDYPLNVKLRSPVTVKNGKLTAIFDNETYTPIPSLSNDPNESLDTEVHLIIQYQQTAGQQRTVGHAL